MQITTSSKSLTGLLPHEYSGWKAESKDKFYDNETLYNYIDGGAELYISYGFSEVISRRYTKAGQPEIRVDIFDMIKSGNAYGVYTHSRERIEHNYGQGSQTLIGAVLFWKDRFYISILCQTGTTDCDEAIHGLAKAIDAAIPNEGSIPGVVKLLPEDNLVAESVTYFHHPVWLNYFAWLFESNYLNINKETSAVWAKYETTRKRAMLLLVQYPDEHTARLGYDSFKRYFFSNPESGLITKDENDRWLSSRLEGKLFAAVFDAPDKDFPKALLDKIHNK